MHASIRLVSTFGSLIPAVLIVMIGWTSTAIAGQDEEAVERILRAASTAAATFSETRDKQAVLKLYTEDYEGTQDGQTETRAAIEKWLDDYAAELDQGSTLRFIGAVSNVTVRISGSLAAALYDYVFQAVRKGELEGQDRGKCTTLLRKDTSGWVIFHEHCSKARIPQ